MLNRLTKHISSGQISVNNSSFLQIFHSLDQKTNDVTSMRYIDLAKLQMHANVHNK